MARKFLTRPGRRSGAAVVLGAAAVGLLGAGAAVAVSGGPYNAPDQGCPQNGDAWSHPGAYPGCHNVQILVKDDSGHQYVEAGTEQTAQHQNLHSGTVMITPNGDGNPYGDPSAGPVTGPAAGASFDTNWQPLPPSACAAEDAALYAIEWASYVAGQSGSQCSIAPVAWSGPDTPLTNNAAEGSEPWNPASYTSAPSPAWLQSATLNWNAPSAPPSLQPWDTTGDPSTTALDLLMGGQLYASGDDNVNTGEHDGMDGQYASGNTYDSSPDGGGTYLDWQPQSGAATMSGWPALILDALTGRSAAPLAPIAQNPVPVADFGFGLGFDGPYVGVYTNQRTLYQGGGGSNSSTSNQRDIYNYQEPDGKAKDWQPQSCSNGSVASEQACTTQPGSDGVTRSCPSTETQTTNDNTCGANYYRWDEASDVDSEPGVMIYNNPDPQSNSSGAYPLPAFYAGTCGVAAGGGAMSAPPVPAELSPVAYTNSAGQVVAADPTGC